MKVEITIGLEEYEGVGTSEAYFVNNELFDINPNNHSLTLDVWGADIFTEDIGSKILEQLKVENFHFISDEIHINGKTTFTFQNVVRVAKSNGEVILKTDIENKQSVSYVIGGVLPNRKIFDEITIVADELLTIAFDTDDFISIKEYCKNPKEYSYKG